MILRLSQLVASLALIALTAWAWKSPPIADQPDWNALGISHSEGMVFRTDGARRVKLDIYRPSQAAVTAPSGRLLRPAAVVIHGGSWRGGSMAEFRHDPQKVVARLAQRGLVVFAIDYQLARPGSPSWPGAIDDLREAVRWVRRHGGEFDVDSGHIAVVGQSSGGHLASLLATLPEAIGPDGVSSRVQAVVNFYGPSDLAGLMRIRGLSHEPARTFLGEAVAGLTDRATLASPLDQVTTDAPPMLLIHGDDDAWVPVDHSVRMAHALDRLGIPYRLIVVHGARHGFETALKTPIERDLIPEIVDFLERAWNRRIDGTAASSRPGS
jgi:acetyl esterase/lipase